MWRIVSLLGSLPLFMVACGGSGNSGPTQAPTYTVSGTVTGLAGQGLVLQNNGGDDLRISASGAFTFSTAVLSGDVYDITVKGYPTSPLQACTVVNASGIINYVNVTNVAVRCEAGVAVQGQVSGLVGSGFGLAICTRYSGGYGYGHPHGPYTTCGTSLQISADGTFTLGGAYPTTYSGSDFVAVAQQPSSPTQRCAVANALVETQVANHIDVAVNCAAYSYATNAADNTVSAYALDATSGALAAVGVPIVTGSSPSAIVGTSDKRLVFVANEGSNDITAYAVNPATGALTAVPGSPFPAGTSPESMVVVDSLAGPAYLFAANEGSDSFSAFDIDATGALSHRSLPATPIATGKGPTSIAVRPGRGLFIYVANHGGSNDISVFDSGLNPVSGSPFPAGGSPLSLAFGAGGTYLYTANPDAMNPSISGFNVDPDTGALSALGGSPFPLPVSHYIASDQTGTYLYVTLGASIVGYAIDAATGALTALPGFPVAAGADAYSISIDSTNQFLYVANEGATTISGFRLDASTGALTPLPGSSFPAGNQPEFIATF